jgi:hypothetical protein
MLYYYRNALIPAVTSPLLINVVSFNQDHYDMLLLSRPKISNFRM